MFPAERNDRRLAGASKTQQSGSGQGNGRESSAEPSQAQNPATSNTGSSNTAPQGSLPFTLPTVALPTAGGSIRGIGEKFSVNPATGTGSFVVPVATSQGRGNGVELSLSYDSGSGNGPFGMGWSLSTASIQRKTDKGLPLYQDADESDVYVISGAEDLVPVLEWHGKSKHFGSRKVESRKEDGRSFKVFSYQPRIEGSFQRILRLTDTTTGETHWEVKTTDNTTTVFGDTDNCRVFNPENPAQVFEWLPSRTSDEKGNLTVFEYKAENSEGVDVDSLREQHRTYRSRSAHRYLKSIKYGNTTSRASPKYADGTGWLFEVVFDYGEHHHFVPTPKECQPWLCRADPFSSYRSGFEIRQYRLCRRVLMFHHFPEEPGIGRDCIVSSFDLSYALVGQGEATGLAITTTVKSVSHDAWRRNGAGYDRQSLPPLEFTYTTAKPAEIPQDLDCETLRNLPVGFNDAAYQLIDLEGQGLAGAVSKVDGGLIYISNNGEGEFGAAESLSRVPGSVFSSAASSWMDLSGDGKVELVRFDGPTPGFYSRNWDEEPGWDTFQPFDTLPNIPWSDRNVKLIDVTGDGLADVLILDDNLLCFYHGWGKSGFKDPEYLRPPLDENEGPRLLFWDGVEALYTADMTGDRLVDLVRIRQSEVAYWPNLGYGRFGSKIVMDNPPTFDYSSQFDQTLLRLADVDGTGTTDLIYLGAGTPTMYHNLSGNGWSDGTPIHGFPSINNATNVQVVDLLGKGTACLVWSSSLPGDVGHQMRYLDLMEQGKPYLLVAMENNMGSETRLTYTSSSLFYARDKKAGRPWISHLPFPVQVVEKSETVDRISGNIFTSRYAYHDGYFDGTEREFRGFGMVETWDTEHYSSLDADQRRHSNIDEASHIPPVLTKAWYHTGQYQDDRCPTRYYRHEYYRDLDLHPDLADVRLSETTLPSSLRTSSGWVPYSANYQEQQEAYRALKGSPLRSEVFCVDGTDLESIPVSVSESNFVIEQRQPLGNNKHAVFLVHPKEAVEMLYDRKLYPVGSMSRLDPRVKHSMTLHVDFFGNPLKTMAINYGRRYDDPNPILTVSDRQRQRRPYAMLTETRYTNMIDTPEAYVLPAVAESSSFEVINVISSAECQNAGSWWVEFEDAVRIVALLSSGKFDIPFENFDGPYPSTTSPYRRMLKKTRSIFRKNDLSGPLPLGVIESMMLPFKNHGLAFTDPQAHGYVASGKLKPEEIEGVFGNEGAYLRFSGEEGWWSNGPEVFYSPNRSDSSEEELLYAKENFFFIHRSRTPWDTDSAPTESTYTYDEYHLLAQSVMDPYGNMSTVGERDKDPSKPLLRSGHDYRLLVPFIIMDENRNRSEIAFDILGQVVASAIRGKPEDEEGDDVAGLKTDLSDKEVKSYFQMPLIHTSALLGTATARTVYDLHAFRRTKHLEHPLPNWSSSITRETHTSDLPKGVESRTFVGFSYVDGTGRPIQAKAQCEAGPLEPGDALEKHKDKGDTLVHHRWVTSSWVIYNNKGNAVRNYEPFFSDNHRFQGNAIHGVSPLFIYDSLSRGVAIINPDHSWTKVVFSPWESQSWDKTDTVLLPNPADDPDVGSFVRRFPQEDYLPTWYSQRRLGELGPEEEKAAKDSASNAGTPSIAYYDAMGRDCVKFETLRPGTGDTGGVKDEILRQATFVDIQGLTYKVIDTLGRTASRLTYNFVKIPIKEEHMDNGPAKLSLQDVSGSPLRTWNGRGQVFRPVYDRKRRVTSLYLGDGSDEYLIEKTNYGELQANSESSNSRGRIVESFDQSGVTHTSAYDFKGNLMSCTRQLAKRVQGTIDWNGDVELEVATYDELINSNALNQVTTTTLPDGTETSYTYNDRGMPQTISTTLSSDKTKQEVIKEIDYDAKGQRTRVLQGNGVETRVSFDKFTFLIKRLVTTRSVARTGSSSSGLSSDSDSVSRKHSAHRRRRIEKLQDMKYTYDVAGNITHIKDDAKQTIFFRNHRVEPSRTFRYDSLYRLVEATGREHIGQMMAAKEGKMKPGNSSSTGEAAGDHAHDGKALTRYIERYEYDSQGNILALHHETPGESSSWTRHYEYSEPSAVVSSEKSNRLSRTRIGRRTEEYHYDGPAGITGSMTSMPGIPSLGYDYGDKLVATSAHPSNPAGEASQETTYYRYDATGKRVRKVTERTAADSSTMPVKETIYIGGAFEVFRRYNGTGEVTLEIHSLSIAESGRRLLLIDNRTIGSDTRSPGTVYRYQLANHQGSATMEVDQDAKILSYEEYTPYGVSSIRSTFSQTEAPKRYRFLGKELDDSGLYHFEARYYAAWLGRFTSADPKGAADGLNLYQYAQSNPVMLADPGGTNAGPVDAALGWTEKVIKDRRNMAAKAWKNLKNSSWASKLGVNNNIFGERAGKDFARMLQNEVSSLRGAAEFETTFDAAKGMASGSRTDIIFRNISEVWEHKLISVNRFFKKSGEFRKGGKEALGEVMERWSTQLKTATTNIEEAGQALGASKLGITIKGVAESGAEMQSFITKVEEALPGRAITFVHEMEPALANARAEIDAAARITRPMTSQLLVSGSKAAKFAGGAGKVVGKVLGKVGPIAAVVGVITLASTAYGAETGKDVLGDPVAPMTHGERLQFGMDVASTVAGGASSIAGIAVAKGLVGAGVATGAAAASAVLGGAAAGAMVGSMVQEKLEKPLEEHLGERAGAAVAAGTGVLAGAAAGAVVGALIGSVVPGLGTAAGAAIGGIAGAAGAGAKILINRFWP